MRLKKIAISVIALFSLMVYVPAHALPIPTDILIVELQVRSAAAADQEFVELYNTTDNPIDVSSWKLQYKSATGTTWADKVTLHGSLDAHSHYLLISDKYPNPPTAATDGTPLSIDIFSAGLSDSGGHVRIADLTVPAIPIVHDLLGWGSTANAAEGNTSAIAPGSGKSLQRKSLDGAFIDTDNNANDFEISDTPSPQADPLYVPPVEEPEPAPEPDPTLVTPLNPQDSTDPSSEQPEATPTTDVPEQQPAAVELLAPQITELLPNPAAPASDSTDEFIELYNPNDQPLDMTNYKLQSGNTFSYSYTFEGLSLAAHEYKAFLVTQTGDILSNTSSQVRLLDPAGSVVAQTNNYESAAEGQAWALINGAWQWTITPTPNAENILTAEPAKPVGIVKAASTKTTAKTASKPAATTKAPAKAKAATAKTAKATTTPARAVYQDPAVEPPSVHPAILAGIGAITLLYAGYEYRNDAINTYRRFQRYRGLRRAARTASSGR